MSTEICECGKEFEKVTNQKRCKECAKKHAQQYAKDYHEANKNNRVVSEATKKKNNDRAKSWFANLTPEQRIEYNRKQRERKQKKKAGKK